MFLLRKRRAVRMPLTDSIINDMINYLLPYAINPKLLEENQYSNADIGSIWLREKHWQTGREMPFRITICDNENAYIDLVFLEEDVSIEGFVTAKCRPLHRTEKYQISLTDCYLDKWMDSLRMVEYMYDIHTNFHEDCYTTLFDPYNFNHEQTIIPHKIVDEKLVNMVEQTAINDLRNSLNDMEDLNGSDPISQAVLFDRFSINKENRSVYWTYYNPDSFSGGQFVHNTITFDQINNETAVDPEAFFDNLGSVAEQILIDTDDDNFIEVAHQNLIYPADLVGCTFSTMAALKLIAAQK